MTTIFSLPGKDYRQIAPLFLRLAAGAGFVNHGWAKLTRGPEYFGALLQQLHVPFPGLMAWVSALTELLGGLALLTGLLVSLATVPLICTMLVAMFTIHLHYGFSAVKTIGLTAKGPVFGPPGYEINLIYIAGLLALLLMGAGRYSLDSVLAKRASH
jgi:putative oxidoreductase